MADFKPNSCETCYCYGMDHDSNLKACWHCTVSGHHTFESKNFWEPTEWFEAYQQLEARRDELERWYSEHVAATAQLRDDLAAAQEKLVWKQRTIDDIVQHLRANAKYTPFANNPFSVATEFVTDYIVTKGELADIKAMDIFTKLEAANERIKELEAQLHPKCTCEKCTGIPDPYKEGEQ
jgi:hypothetical protein